MRKRERERDGGLKERIGYERHGKDKKECK
jgi:hypothetical protein